MAGVLLGREGVMLIALLTKPRTFRCEREMNFPFFGPRRARNAPQGTAAPSPVNQPQPAAPVDERPVQFLKLYIHVLAASCLLGPLLSRRDSDSNIPAPESPSRPEPALTERVSPFDGLILPRPPAQKAPATGSAGSAGGAPETGSARPGTSPADTPASAAPVSQAPKPPVSGPLPPAHMNIPERDTPMPPGQIAGAETRANERSNPGAAAAAKASQAAATVPETKPPAARPAPLVGDQRQEPPPKPTTVSATDGPSSAAHTKPSEKPPATATPPAPSAAPASADYQQSVPPPTLCLADQIEFLDCQIEHAKLMIERVANIRHEREMFEKLLQWHESHRERLLLKASSGQAAEAGKRAATEAKDAPKEPVIKASESALPIPAERKSGSAASEGEPVVSAEPKPPPASPTGGPASSSAPQGSTAASEEPAASQPQRSIYSQVIDLSSYKIQDYVYNQPATRKPIEQAKFGLMTQSSGGVLQMVAIGLDQVGRDNIPGEARARITITMGASSRIFDFDPIYVPRPDAINTASMQYAFISEPGLKALELAIQQRGSNAIRIFVERDESRGYFSKPVIRQTYKSGAHFAETASVKLTFVRKRGY